MSLDLEKAQKTVESFGRQRGKHAKQAMDELRDRLRRRRPRQGV
jgi:hypothetical protein